MSENNKTFEAEAVSELEEQTKDFVNDWEKNLEEKKSKTTPKGRKSKDAKEAEAQEILVGMAQGFLTGLNQLAKKYAPELEHDEAEIETISKLSAPIANKYVDIKASEYEHEYRLASYLIVAEAPKIDALLSRIKTEMKEKRQAKESKEKKKTREGLKIPLNNSEDKEDAES